MGWLFKGIVLLLVCTAVSALTVIKEEKWYPIELDLKKGTATMSIELYEGLVKQMRTLKKENERLRAPRECV